MPFVGQVASAPANTDFVNYGQEVFDRGMAAANSSWSLFTDVRGTIGSEGIDLFNIGPSPGVSEITSSRPFASLRKYNRRIPPKKWGPDGISLRRDEVEGDKTGAVAKRLKDYLDVVSDFYWKPVIDTLLGNPTGIDGVAILSNSHPHGPSGATWDNLAAAWSTSVVEGSIERMYALRNEYGEPMGIRPTHILVGPALEKEALEFSGSDRIVPIGPAGAEAATSVNAAVVFRNWVGGRFNVIMDPRITGTGFSSSWFLMDLSKPGVRPIVGGEVIGPQAFVADSPNSPHMIDRSEYAYYAEAFASIGGAIPHVIDGYIA